MADEIQTTQGTPTQGNVDPLILQAALQRLKAEQNLVLALIAGGAAALLGAVAWALVTTVTGYQSGFMAIGVGYLVGYAVKSFGKGLDRSFGIIGAGWSLLGCAGGNLFTVVALISKQQNIPLMDLVEKLDGEIIANLMRATFNPMDLVFYAIAVYEGYRFSFRPITEQDLIKIS
jgi:hypothetical protein